MIPSSDKVALLGAFMADGGISETHICTFFKDIINHQKVLDRFHFVERENISYDYLISINLQTGQPCIWIKGKVYKEAGLLRAISRLLKETNATVYIFIETNRHRIKAILHKISYHTSLTEYTIFEANMNYIVRSYRAKQLLTKIDEALDDNDRDSFMRFSAEYNELMDCFYE